MVVWVSGRPASIDVGDDLVAYDQPLENNTAFGAHGVIPGHSLMLIENRERQARLGAGVGQGDFRRSYGGRYPAE
jgi:hypothetical protein